MTMKLSTEYRKRWYANHPLYASWQDMRQRCGIIRGASKSVLEQYLGIDICEEWLVYAAYEGWAMSNGWAKGLKVARKDKTGDFKPDNCVVVPYEEAVNMRRNTFRVEGIPLRKLIGGTAKRGDRRYLRIKDRILNCSYDTSSAICTPVVERAECARLATRTRMESMNETLQTETRTCANCGELFITKRKNGKMPQKLVENHKEYKGLPGGIDE